MPGFEQTTETWARLRGQAPTKSPASAKAVLRDMPDFGPNPGQLRMLVHAPAGLAAGRPLIVVLHGCTQSAQQYAAGAGWIELADRLGLALVCPEQTATNNPNRCFNWFEPGDIGRGLGEAASIRSMVDAAAGLFASDRKQIFVTGLSAGGAMSSVMLAAYPDLFAGGGVIAGLPYGVANGMPQAFAAMFQEQTASAADLGRKARGASSHPGPWPRVSVWHGSADTTVKPSNADAIVRQWCDVHGVPVDAGVKGDGPGHGRWMCDGVCVVERRLIPGMGHGTPLATGGADGVGAPGPFLLEAGVSSSLELTKFWGIEARTVEAPADVRAAAPLRVATPPALRPAARTTAEPSAPAKEEQGVAAVINRALRAAGLMKS